MKLYATITSERASKGQGGNRYLDIIITDQDGKEKINISLMPQDDGDILIIENTMFYPSAYMRKKHGGGYAVDSDDAKRELAKIKGKK